MNIIKLNTIDSTNLFLKDLAKNTDLENFTVVVADAQTAGKGQMNTTWNSEKGKNLLFTIYIKMSGLSIDLAPYVSFLSASIIREVVSESLDEKNKVRIKWPNDILSYHDKIAGILVENTIKKNKIDASFIGVGLNVNQKEFPEYLPKASSMAKISNISFDRDEILEKIVLAFKQVLSVDYIENNLTKIKQDYLAYLYKIQVPSMFADTKGNTFMGKIINVSDEGLLLLEKDDDLIYSYDVKEIKFL